MTKPKTTPKLSSAQLAFLQTVNQDHRPGCVDTYKPALKLIDLGLIKVSYASSVRYLSLTITEVGSAHLAHLKEVAKV